MIDAGVLVEWFARAAVGSLLVCAAIAKLRAGSSRVRDAVAGYDILPRPIVAPAAGALPWIEIAVGAALVLGIATRTAAVAAASLLVVFALAVSLSLLRGSTSQPCGCSGDLRPVQWSVVRRNLTLAALLVPVLMRSSVP